MCETDILAARGMGKHIECQGIAQAGGSRRCCAEKSVRAVIVSCEIQIGSLE